jgi:hypothetical protein
MKYIVSLFFIAFASGIVGCQKTDSMPNAPLTASFQLINEQGQEAAVFPQGQNVVFRFQLTNISDQDISVKTQSSTLGTFWKCLAR